MREGLGRGLALSTDGPDLQESLKDRGLQGLPRWGSGAGGHMGPPEDRRDDPETHQTSKKVKISVYRFRAKCCYFLPYNYLP